MYGEAKCNQPDKIKFKKILLNETLLQNVFLPLKKVIHFLCHNSYYLQKIY